MIEIELALYRHEALFLFEYLKQRWEQTKELMGAAADSDFVLAEWLHIKYWTVAERIDRRRPVKTTKVKMPVSVARILWKNWQQEFISPPLQLVLQGIDSQLKNKNLAPIQL